MEYKQDGLIGFVGCTSDWRPNGCGFDPRYVRYLSFMEIDHEIFSLVILILPLIQEGQLPVSGQRMCTSTGYLLRAISLSRKIMVR